MKIGVIEICKSLHTHTVLALDMCWIATDVLLILPSFPNYFTLGKSMTRLMLKVGSLKYDKYYLAIYSLILEKY